MSAAIAPSGFGTSVRPRAAEVPASPVPTATRLRLTRRGRIVFTALGALPLVIWAVVTILGSGGAAADIGAQFGARTFDYVTVHQGDSLWAIAESIAPQGDPRVVIDEIMRLNGLDEATLEPGQRLALPVVP
ncbi:LysM peptidoglycan-binding domain-containing protein [Agromyces sp. H66]|uniref:LysM peptidoglycan-binding domain-containing protein n=1 Tax=Agromyces sp. H66 TaxID=2529859 RepID=UPI0010AB2424|nr:LysM peptidoglycan-binding domain-containing protein [Agromyces sp. H66]